MSTAARFSSFRAKVHPLALTACCLQLIVTLPLAYILNVWQDDAYTLHSTSGSLAYAFHEAIGFEQNAPLYFVVIDLWRHVDQSAFFARLFSVLCAAAAVALTPKLATRYLPSIDPRAVVFAVALNPFLIWTALEIRVYAMIVLLGALLLLTYYDAFLAERPSRRAAWLYSLWVCVAMYTQYYLAFLVLAQGLLLLFQRRRSLVAFVGASAAGVVPFIPMLAILPGQMQNFRGGYLPPTLPGSAANLAGILAHYMLPLEFLEHRRILYGLAVLAAVSAALLLRRRFARSGDLAIAAIGIFAGAALVLGTYIEGVHILTRHAASLLLPAVFAPFAGISYLREPERARATGIWFAIVFVAGAGTLFVTYRSGAKIGDWARVAKYVTARETPGEPILVFQAENALPFEYYYHGPNSVIPVPRGVDFRSYDVDDFVVHSESQIDRVIPKNASRIWFIRAGECNSANIQFGCDIVDRYLALNYRVVEMKNFYRSNARLLIRRILTPR